MPNESKTIRAAGGYGNLVLYRMCREQPSHSSQQSGQEIVRSKARMIAKVYEVSRNLGNDYGLIVKVLCSKQLALDRSLANLGNVHLETACLDEIVKIHGKVDRLLCRALAKASGGRKVHSRASFVSKYLHFHCPDSFPILDSLAEVAVKHRTSSGLPKARLVGKNASDRYERFCRALVDIRDAGDFCGISLREIDTELVAEGRRLRERGET